jgi:glycosyltransferase involved in cell wall biosynthesis
MIALTHPEWCKPSNAWHYGVELPRSIRRATVVVAPTETVKREIVARVGVDRAKVRVVPLGISPEMHPVGAWEQAAVRREYDLPERYVLWVGNLEPKKNVEGMVRAFELAAEAIPHDFVLVGQRGWRGGAAARALEQSPAAKRIRWLGFVPEHVLPALYGAADLLVHWAHYEGAGLTPVEAMACGTPALVSDGGALPEWAGQVAPVVPLGDPGRLAREMVALLGDRARLTELRQRGAEWARQFTWRRHAHALMEIYREVAGLGS